MPKNQHFEEKFQQNFEPIAPDPDSPDLFEGGGQFLPEFGSKS